MHGFCMLFNSVYIKIVVNICYLYLLINNLWRPVLLY